jgi:aminopeptidase N
MRFSSPLRRKMDIHRTKDVSHHIPRGCTLKPLIAAMPFVFLPFLFGSDKGDTNIMAGRIDVGQYSIRVRIEDQDSVLWATTEIEFRVLTDIQVLQFNLREMKVASCSVDGRPLAFEHKNGVLSATTQSTLRPGSIHKLSVEYSGRPKDGLFIGKNKYNHFCAFADNWPNRARYWFPSIDHPSDKATVLFYITVPNQYEAIANGTLLKPRHRRTKRSPMNSK